MISQCLDLSPAQIDCATAVMLKILDGKCKMPSEEMIIMEQLYDEVFHQQGLRLGQDQHMLISKARHERDQTGLTSNMREQVYEQRLYAETMISRPIMKAFKSHLRDKGLLPNSNKPETEQ